MPEPLFCISRDARIGLIPADSHARSNDNELRISLVEFVLVRPHTQLHESTG